MKISRILMVLALGLLVSCGGETKEEKKESVKIGGAKTEKRRMILR